LRLDPDSTRRRAVARDRGDAALHQAIKQHRRRIKQYLDLGLAEKAAHEYEALVKARRRQAAWFKETADWTEP